MVRLCVFPLLFCLVYCLFVCLSILVYPFVCLIIHLSIFVFSSLCVWQDLLSVCLSVWVFFYCFTCKFTINLFVWIFSCFHLLVCWAFSFLYSMFLSSLFVCKSLCQSVFNTVLWFVSFPIFFSLSFLAYLLVRLKFEKDIAFSNRI